MSLISTDYTDPLPASAAGGSGWRWISGISGIISGISGKEKEAMGTYDESWKEVVEKFFPWFLEFFFPLGGVDG